MQYMPSGNRSCACHIGSPCLTATRPSASELGVSHNVSHRSWACGIGWACGIDWACLITTRPSGRASQLQDPHPNHAHASTHSKKFLNGMLALVHWLWYSVYVWIGMNLTRIKVLWIASCFIFRSCIIRFTRTISSSHSSWDHFDDA